jgi:hypothetical protein
VTWGNGNTGGSGTVSEANSLVGSNPGDRVGYTGTVIALSSADYVVGTSLWNGQRGAVTWISGATGQTLDGTHFITPQNSIVGQVPNAFLHLAALDPIQQSFLTSAASDDGGRVTVGLPLTDPFSFARGYAQGVTLTPNYLTRTLNTGTAVVLQASNDITVNSPITVSAGGQGGALTLQTGRSILFNASITTDNGALTLIANDPLADGVVDSQRDPGNAVISMAPGAMLDTGSGALAVELRDGAGLTSRDSGPISLQNITAGSVSVLNNGPSAGSGVELGPVATSGPQSYANPSGTTMVAGNLTAVDNPIMFADSVAVQAGLALNPGSSTVDFAAGTVAPSPGVVAVASVAFSGTTTLSLTLSGTDLGSYSELQASGIINLGGSTLTLVFGFEPPVGTAFEIIANTGSAPTSGTFNGLAEGAIFLQGGYQFQITYQGGTGGDSVVLTRVA